MRVSEKKRREEKRREEKRREEKRREEKEQNRTDIRLRLPYLDSISKQNRPEHDDPIAQRWKGYDESCRG